MRNRNKTILKNFTLFICVFFFSVALTFITLSAWNMSQPKSDMKDSATPSITPITSNEDLPNSKFEIKASIPYWDQENAIEVFKENSKSINYINLFWYYLGENGEIRKYEYAKEDSEIIAFAHANNIKVSAVITNLPEYEGATWDSERVISAIIKAKRGEHIKNIIDKLNSLNFDGVIIDYESVDFKAKNTFTNFIRDLSIELHKDKKILTVALHPKTSDNKRGESIGRFQDWKAISEYADQLQIMGYSEHSDADTAGPIASTPWVERILKYVVKLNIPTEKVFLGIPLYGYDWNKNDDSNASGLTFSDVEKILLEHDIKAEWDDQSESPYFTYVKNKNTHEVWFENARSVEKKIILAKKYGLSGVTFWRLGDEDPNLWKTLSRNNLTFL